MLTTSDERADVVNRGRPAVARRLLVRHGAVLSLVKEKEPTRARDALAAERRRMPRMPVKKDYRFEGPTGPRLN